MTTELITEDPAKVINWDDAPSWATAVIKDALDNYFWIQEWGTDTKRQEFGLPDAEKVTANTSGDQTNWTLIESRT